ncbi:lmo0937 family membrane protein [Sporosarcina sp. P3]|uniref:lmo0937 family membrane protein n=1 Tax=Sporosarcina sp. P3 TaxID=2048245 RepID=UPI00117B1DF0|nr:lmo0937 family membrane protein [Sporosarcina sp. P3]
MGRILWLVIIVLIALWVIGLVANIGGGLIHTLLVIAGIIFVIQLITGRRSV